MPSLCTLSGYSAVSPNALSLHAPCQGKAAKGVRRLALTVSSWVAAVTANGGG